MMTTNRRRPRVKIPFPGSRKRGLPPGSLFYIGPQKKDPVKIVLYNYSPATFTEKIIQKTDEILPFRDEQTTTWINVDGVHDVKIIEQLGAALNLHPLLLEDLVNTHQRPKTEEYDDHLFTVVRMLMYDENDASVKSEQVSVVLSKTFVVSFQQGVEGDLFNPIRDRIRNENSKMRSAGNDYLFYRLLDVVVDHYFLIMEKTGDKIEKLEETILQKIDKNTLHEVQSVKRDLLLMRRSIYPLREVLSFLSKEGNPYISKRTQRYFRDVHDHTVQIIETLEMFREMVTALKEAYQSQINMQMNQTIKTLTIIATIFIPLTFIAGIYGMNFDFMPELHWRFGYFYALGLMGIVGVIMVVYFRTRHWL